MKSRKPLQPGSEGVRVPALNRVGRAPGSAGLFFRRQVRRLVALLPDGTRRELGRLSEEEARATAGDWLVQAAGRMRPASMAGYGMGRGVHVWEDFAVYGTSSHLGQYGWYLAGSGAGVAVQASTEWGEAGIIRITPDAGNATGGAALRLSATATPMLGGDLPDKAFNIVKVRLGGTTTNLTGWAGLSSDGSGFPPTGSNSLEMVGFKVESGGAVANWHGVCRRGTSETTLNLGVAADSSWRVLAWRCESSNGVRFYVGNATTGRLDPVGVISADVPGGSDAYAPIVAVKNTTAASRYLECDFYGLGWLGSRW